MTIIGEEMQLIERIKQLRADRKYYFDVEGDGVDVVLADCHAALESSSPEAATAMREEPSPADDDEVRAFIAGWNAARCTDYDFDMALHWWRREQCGL